MEFGIGDNDTLASIVAVNVQADLLILLSDIDGLYTANPNTNPDAKLIHRVEKITPEIVEIAGGKGSELGTGGMSTKIKAAEFANGHGIDMVVANGTEPQILYDIVDGGDIGTRFIAGRK